MANQIKLDLLGMYRRAASSETFVDIKQEIKVEAEEIFYGFDDEIVEVVDPQQYQKESTKRNIKVALVKSLNRFGRRESFVKKDKDAGLITCQIDGVKHYQCEFCGKKDFTSRSRLRTHMQIHTSERNFMCQVNVMQSSIL